MPNVFTFLQWTVIPAITVPAYGQSCPASCPADIAPRGGDGQVDVLDLNAVNNHWGSCDECSTACKPCPGDIDGNCSVDVEDLLLVQNNWGACPSPSESWTYSVNPPTAPAFDPENPIVLTNPTIAQIKSALGTHGSGRHYDINGTIDPASVIETISLNADDVWLDFDDCAPFTWSGGFNSGRFLIVGSNRAKISGLKFDGNAGSISGVFVADNSSDIQFAACEFNNTRYAFEAHLTTRLHLVHSKFMATTASYSGWFGKAGAAPQARITDIIVERCEFTTASTNGERPIRMDSPLRARFAETVIESHPSAPKDSFWAYGAEELEIWKCTFKGRRMRLGNTCESPFNVPPTQHVRISNCDFVDIVDTGLATIELGCHNITRDVKMRHLRSTNCSNYAMMHIGWRDHNPPTTCQAPYASESRDIRWFINTMCKDGAPMSDSDINVSNDWSANEQQALNITACE